jgi:hypothetical protein
LLFVFAICFVPFAFPFAFAFASDEAGKEQSLLAEPLGLLL